MKTFLILVATLYLCSCGTVGKLIPSLGYENGNQSTTSADTLSQSIGHASVDLTAGTNKTKSYGDKSNIKSNDLNADMQLSQNASNVNFGGSHIDNSHKKIISTTNKDNKNTAYNSLANQIIYNRMPFLELLLIMCFITAVSFFLLYIVYRIGIIIGKLKTKVFDMRKKRYINYRTNNKLHKNDKK